MMRGRQMIRQIEAALAARFQSLVKAILLNDRQFR